MFPSSAQAYQSLSDFTNTRRSSKDVYRDAESKYDVPGRTTRLSRLRGLVGNLQSSVEAVDPSVTGRTSGSFVSEGARQALVAKERQPLLSDLSKQQGALGQEEQGFSLASTLASDLARSMLSEDATRYQEKLDAYTSALAREQAAEEKRRWDLQFEESQRQARAAQGGGGYDIGSLVDSLTNGGATGGAGAQSDQEKAYIDVQKFLKGDDASIRSDYNATLNSANRGNAKDKAKIEFYKQARPDLFGPKGQGYRLTPKTAGGAYGAGIGSLFGPVGAILGGGYGSSNAAKGFQDWSNRSISNTLNSAKGLGRQITSWWR